MLSKLKISLLFLVFASLSPLHGADLSGAEKSSDVSWMPSFSLFANNFSVDALWGVALDWWGNSYVDDDEPRLIQWTITEYNRDKKVRTESSKIKELILFGQIGFPKDIALFTNLKRLDLSETCLFSAPTWLERYFSSYYLLLKYGEPTYDFLSEDVTSLMALQKLVLNKNYLTVLPESLGKLVNLEGLYVGSNKLTALPSTFSSLLSLTDLYLESNYLSDLPSSFGKLSCLKILNLRSNKFKSFPTEILNIVALKQLYIDDNKIRHIPTEIGNMKKLRSFTARNNKLLIFPVGILKLEKLDFLGLEQNPCLDNLSKDYSNKAYSRKDSCFPNNIEELKDYFREVSP